ncbi:MAG: sensor histidine kinase [Myxococcota bacterium]
MLSSIRLRVGLAVFSVILALLSLQLLVVLDRVVKSGQGFVDARLREELSAVRTFLGTPAMDRLIETENLRFSKWDEIFIEVRDERGRRVLGTQNLPPEGLAPAGSRPEAGAPRIGERVHPASHKGHRRIRVLETRIGPFGVWIGATLKRHQKLYWALRERLLSSLLLITLLGAGAAYLVATRSLSPLRRLTNEARRLGATGDGLLPQTGRDDELDGLASVLNELLVRVRSEMARMRRMTADAGHALRTPLTALRGSLEMRLRGIQGGGTDGLETALEEVDRLIRSVNQLLLLEKLAPGALDASCLELTELGKLVENLVEHYRIVAEEQGVELRCSVAAVCSRVDPLRMQEALGNLLDNALRHTPRGGRVEVSLRLIHDRIELRVSDSGPGLRPDQLERVFERFYSEPGQGSGIGLGLPIARAIAHAHRGDLVAASERGACFLLWLPAPDGHSD